MCGVGKLVIAWAQSSSTPALENWHKCSLKKNITVNTGGLAGWED